MVRKKASRAASRAKATKKVETELTEEQINLQKRLDDFDRQVSERVKKMEDDQKLLWDSMRNKFLLECQRAPDHIKNMPYQDVLKQNIVNTTNLRESIDTLLQSVDEEITLKKKRGRAKTKTTAVDTPAEASIRRSARNKNASSGILSAVENNMPPPTASKTRKGRTMETPVHQNIVPSQFVTPKFDMRKPIPPSTKRKIKRGEVVISLQGSPVEKTLSDIIEEFEEEAENLTEEERKAVNVLKRKVY